MNKKLPQGVVNEINQMLAEKLGKPEVSQLSKSDYQSTKVVDFIDWMLSEDPLNLLSPLDKKLFQMARDSLSTPEIENMSLLEFYANNI